MPTAGFQYDRAMALHRRAFELQIQGRDYAEWIDLSTKLDCPADAVQQIWSTAAAAREAGMTDRQAFPSLIELEKSLTPG